MTDSVINTGIGQPARRVAFLLTRCQLLVDCINTSRFAGWCQYIEFPLVLWCWQKGHQACKKDCSNHPQSFDSMSPRSTWKNSGKDGQIHKNWKTTGSVQMVERIRIGWNKFRQLVPLLTNRDISLIRRGRLYSSCVRSSMLHGSETWPVRKENEVALQRAVMRMVRWMCNVKVKDRVPGKQLRETLWIDSRVRAPGP